ncbi:Abi family protein [Prevotella sp. HUN102]|uniref:Abi family protein n=1 Tax=Prevotella sp. HUN102 TaxID=1392486 RepID=UPI0004900AB8|nr:Abi family protein [Prevotella sp. HUN102]
MEIYNKPPLTYTEQVELLSSRGMVISDKQRTERHLANISYYRLSAYMLPYKQKENGKILDSFREGVTWDTVYNLYVFDRKLRLLVFDAIERLEVAIRAQIIYQLSHKYGSHWQDRPEMFTPPKIITLRDGRTVTMDVYGDIQKHIKEQLHNNKAEVFIQHYCNKYDTPVNPPSWMSVEVMYFNHLSRICTGLRHRADINGIASYFVLPPKTFCSWLHTINYVRNICAHHARLWNRDMNIVPEKLAFSKSLDWIDSPNTVKRSKLYYFLCMLNYMLQTANPTSAFKHRLKDLLTEYQEVVSLNAMGFQPGWMNEKMWNDKK